MRYHDRSFLKVNLDRVNSPLHRAPRSMIRFPRYNARKIKRDDARRTHFIIDDEENSLDRMPRSKFVGLYLTFRALHVFTNIRAIMRPSRSNESAVEIALKRTGKPRSSLYIVLRRVVPCSLFSSARGIIRFSDHVDKI